MASWRFYQGMRNEWRWYWMDDVGDVVGASDQAFAELTACMANAQESGFDQREFQVHTRDPDALNVVQAASHAAEVRGARPEDAPQTLTGTPAQSAGKDGVANGARTPAPDAGADDPTKAR
jgi:hypothetical protein